MPAINTLGDDELGALAGLIAGRRNRTPGARPWDRHGVKQVLYTLGAEDIDLMTAAAYAAAEDPKADTPSAITWTQYRPKPKDVHRPSNEPSCDICGKTRHMCLLVESKHRDAGVPDTHQFIPLQVGDGRRRPPAYIGNPDPPQEALL